MSVAALTTGLVHSVAGLAVRLEDKTPQPEDVKAGWTALVVFLLLIGAVVVLGFSLVKQLRRAQAAKDAGVYGDEPDAGDGPGGPGEGAEDHTGTQSAPGSHPA